MASYSDLKAVFGAVQKVVPVLVKKGATRSDLDSVVALVQRIKALPGEDKVSQTEIDAVYAQCVEVVRYLKTDLNPRLTQAQAASAATPPPQEAASPPVVAEAAAFNDLQSAADAVVAVAVALNDNSADPTTLDAEVASVIQRSAKLAPSREAGSSYEKGRDLLAQRNNVQGAKQAWRRALEKQAAALETSARIRKLGTLSIPFPADLTGVPSSALPEGVKAPPLTPAERAEDVPKAPTAAPDPLPDIEAPPIPAAMPTQAQLIEYVKGAEFDVREALRMTQELYPGFADMEALGTAIRTALRQFPGDYPDRYTVVWTSAPASADLTGNVPVRTIEIGNASPGPGGQTWRHVGIPAAVVGDQITAYTQAGGLTLDETQYSRKLKESLEPAESDVPIMEGTMSPEEVQYERFYIKEDGAVFFAPDTYYRLVNDDSIQRELDDLTFEEAFVGEWGSVIARAVQGRYQLVGEPDAVVKFLLVLDKMAQALGAVSVAQAAIETAEDDEDEDGWGWGDEEDDEDEVIDEIVTPVAAPQVSAPVSTVNVIEAQVQPAEEDYLRYLRSIFRLDEDTSGFVTGFPTDEGDPRTWTIKIGLATTSVAKIEIETVRLNGEATFKGTYRDNDGWNFRISGQTEVVNFGQPEIILADLAKAVEANAYHIDADVAESIIAGAAEGQAAQNEELLFRDLENYVLERLKEQQGPANWIDLTVGQ